MDDIVKELEDWAEIVNGVQGKAVLMMLSGDVFEEAADEIRLLRTALLFGSGMLATHPTLENEHPENVYKMLMEKAAVIVEGSDG